MYVCIHVRVCVCVCVCVCVYAEREREREKERESESESERHIESRPNGEWGYSTRRHMLGHERPEAVSPARGFELEPSVIY